MTAYYNEIDPYAAQWIRNLIAAGHIAPGEVDERSIEDVSAAELAGFRQCHFFAGIGVWSLALRRAGWPDDREVWTGSCPCQPFSAAGKGAGFADERHLWPAFHWLIEQRRPCIVFGEQVAGRDGLGWLDLVRADVEGSGYALASVDLCAAGLGAPHIRQRLYWVADANGSERWTRADGRSVDDGQARGRVEGADRSGERRSVGVVADAESERQRANESRSDRGDGVVVARSGTRGDGSDDGTACVVGDTDDSRPQGRQFHAERAGERVAGSASVAGDVMGDAECERRESRDIGEDIAAGRADETGRSFWSDVEWLPCRDGKWRPVEPGTFPLVAGLPLGLGRLSAEQRRLVEMAGLDAASLRRAKANRVGRLRGYGNAIVAPVAEAFIRAMMECRP